MKKSLLTFLVAMVILPSFVYADDVIIVEPGRRHHRRRYVEETSEPRFDSRQGRLLIGFGLGGGGLHLGGPGEDRGAFLGNFRMGGGLTNRLLLLGEANTAITSSRNVTTAISSIDFAIQTFAPGGFYFRPAVGFAVRRASVDSGPTARTTQSDTGLSLRAALGDEVRLGPWFAFSPEINVGYSRIQGDNNVSYGFLLGFLWYL